MGEWGGKVLAWGKAKRWKLGGDKAGLPQKMGNAVFILNDRGV